MIIGKALKENKELIDDKEKEIEFSTKYQILSKNTALFAEIINDNNDNNQNELISVNLNDYIKEGDPFISWPNWNQPGPWGGAGGWGNGNAGGAWGNGGSAWGNGNAGGSWGGAGGFDNGNMPSYDFENDNNNIDEEIKDKFENDKSKNYITKLIISQNIIEGYWDENEETKELMNIFQQAKIDIIMEKIKSLNKEEENENKIKYTILVIYYLNTEYSDKIDEYILIINKGKKYLLNQGIKYEDIIDGL